MHCRVAAFTDTYLPTINGVTYTVKTWRDRWESNGGEMSVVYPRTDGYTPDDGEHPVRSLPFPFYDGFRLGLPVLPDGLEDTDIVHAHTPFSLGLSALRLGRDDHRPLVASFHTPCEEYTRYLTPLDPLASRLGGIAQRYERWFLNRADAVVAPTATAAAHLTDELGVATDVAVVPNGVDLDRFRPTDPAAFVERHDLPPQPRIGYTGRHGYEKRLIDLVEAVAAGPDEWSLVLAGDGPAADDLRAAATELGVDLTMLGFLEREELPAFYSALDVFAFPSPVETQGLVALESMACGTPVVGVDAGALRETIEHGSTGYRYQPGDIRDFSSQLALAVDERPSLEQGCLDARDALGLEGSMDALAGVYETVLNGA